MLKDRLKKFRELKSKNASDFAKQNNIEIRTYSSYERGERKPPLEVLEQFVLRYNLNINWLITGEGSMFRAKHDYKRADNLSIIINPEITARHYQNIQEVNGYTDTQMAKILKISDKRYRDLALGKAFPTVEEQNETKKNFNVDMDLFLYGDVEQKTPEISGAVLPKLSPEQYAKLLKILEEK